MKRPLPHSRGGRPHLTLWLIREQDKSYIKTCFIDRFRTGYPKCRGRHELKRERKRGGLWGSPTNSRYPLRRPGVTRTSSLFSRENRKDVRRSTSFSGRDRNVSLTDRTTTLVEGLSRTLTGTGRDERSHVHSQRQRLKGRTEDPSSRLQSRVDT